MTDLYSKWNFNGISKLNGEGVKKYKREILKNTWN